jgi:hypothetical protein
MRALDRIRTFVPFAAAAVLLAGGVACAAAGAATAKRRQMTMYAVATRVQYVNYVGKINPLHDHNPFNMDAKQPPPQKGKGGIPGNSVFFTFKLYSDAGLGHVIGSATYNCSFTFHQHATCDAYYTLKDGTMFASGPVDFTSTNSVLAVSGGTSKYVGSSGEVSTTGPGPDPAAKNETRLDFVLVR